MGDQDDEQSRLLRNRAEDRTETNSNSSTSDSSSNDNEEEEEELFLQRVNSLPYGIGLDIEPEVGERPRRKSSAYGTIASAEERQDEEDEFPDSKFIGISESRFYALFSFMLLRLVRSRLWR